MEMAAYLDGRLDPDERARIEAILAENKKLRTEMVDNSRILATAPDVMRAPEARRQLAWWKPVGVIAAAAAALLIAFLPSVKIANLRAPIATERRLSADDAGAVKVVEPSEYSQIPAGEMRFSWHPVAGASYRVTLTDSVGAALWQTSTTNTSVLAPGSVKLADAGRYYWYVDALRTDGTSITSGPISFTTRAR